MGLWNDIMDESEGYGKKIAENDQVIYWQNSMTKFFEKELETYNNHGFTLKGEFMVVLVEFKNDHSRGYLAIDRITHKPFANWSRMDDFEMKKTLILMDREDDCRLVNMAERKETVKESK